MDEAGSWDNPHERFEVKRINHQEAYSKDGVCSNWAEEFFSRMRRAESGHHHIAGRYVLRYARESSWREGNRRLSNDEQVNRLAALSLKRGKSVDFGGHWQWHFERSSCLSKSFIPTKRFLKITSPVSMMKPYFVSEYRVAGFIRTLLSGLVRSIKTL